MGKDDDVAPRIDDRSRSVEPGSATAPDRKPNSSDREAQNGDTSDSDPFDDTPQSATQGQIPAPQHPLQNIGRLLDRLRGDSLIRNSFFIMLTTLVNSLFGFFFWLLAARLFSTHTVGLTAALVSASTIIILLSCLGVGGTLIQALPKENDSTGWSKTVWAGMIAALTASVVLGAILLFALPTTTHAFGKLHGMTYASLFMVGTLALTFGTILDYVFISERAAGNMVVRNSITATSKVLLVAGFVLIADRNTNDLLGAWTASAIIGALIGIALIFRRRGIQRPQNPSAIVNAILDLRKRIAGNQFIGMGASLLPFLIPLIVTVRLSTTSNAYFYTTWMMAGVFLIISPAVAQSLFAEGVHSPHELLTKARRALSVIGAILLPGIVVMFAFGGLLLSAFGPSYKSHAIGLLRIVLIASIPDAVSNVYVAVMRVQGRLAGAAILNMGMGLGIAVISWILLPKFGINAVGWAFLAMELCGCIFVAVDLSRVRRRNRSFQHFPTAEAV